MLLYQVKNIIGTNIHRSGWPYVVYYISNFISHNSITFIDFIEQIYKYKQEIPPQMTSDWCGVLHHPPLQNIPFLNELWEGRKYETLLTDINWLESSKYLKFGITLSNYNVNFYNQFFPNKIYKLYHPIDMNCTKFDINKYKNWPQIVHSGWFLKNTYIVKQFPTDLPIVILLCGKRYHNIHKLTKEWWQAHNIRNEYLNNCYYINDRISNQQYDRLLSSSIIVTEYIDCSASNTLIECIARNTPIIVNNHPAVIEYIGPNYPGLYNSVEEIPDLLNKVEHMHEYLKAMDKTFLKIETFLDNLKAIVQKEGI